MPVYMVECFWPDITKNHAEEALAKLERFHDSPLGEDPVRPIACFLVPSDGMAFFLFAGRSAAMVEKAGEAAGLPFDRIVETVSVTSITKMV
jgi:hypothetical protein